MFANILTTPSLGLQNETLLFRTTTVNMNLQPMSVFSAGFKERAVLRLEAGERLAAVADGLGCGANCVTNGSMPIEGWERFDIVEAAS